MWIRRAPAQRPAALHLQPVEALGLLLRQAVVLRSDAGPLPQLL